jgi:iron(III) transport system permease protein
LSGLGFRSINLIAALLVVVLIVLPMLALMVQAFWPNAFSFDPNWHFSLSSFFGIFSQPYSFQSVVDSFVLALVTAVVATILGGLVSFAIEWVHIPGQGIFNGFTWLVLLGPSFLIADGWQFLLGPGGVLDVGPLAHVLVSPVGVSLVLALKMFPFATLAISGPMRGIGQDLLYAARLGGASPFRAWRQVVMPLLIPAAAAGALIVFAEVLSDYGVASTLAQSANFPLMTYSIYSAMETFPVDFSQAAALAIVLVFLVAMAQWMERQAVGRRGYITRTGGSRAIAKQKSKHPWLWVTGLSLLFFVAFVVPAAGMAIVSVEPYLGGLREGAHLTFSHYRAILHMNYAAGTTVRSIIYAITAASIGLGAGILVSISWWRRGGWLVTALKALMTTTIAIPGIVLGAGYIFFWDQPFFNRLGLHPYGTPFVLTLAYLAGALPYAVRVASGSMVQIPPNAIFVARLSGAGLTRIIRRVLVPMMRDTWFRVWLLIFAGVVFELPVSELLYPPGAPTLAVGITHQVNNNQFGVAAALTVVSTLAISIIVLAASAWQRRGQRTPSSVPGADLGAAAAWSAAPTVEERV